MPCPIVRDEFRPAIPWRVARQHCPPPLHRQDQNKTIAASNGTIYHRTQRGLLTVCLSRGDNPRFITTHLHNRLFEATFQSSTAGRPALNRRSTSALVVCD